MIKSQSLFIYGASIIAVGIVFFIFQLHNLFPIYPILIMLLSIGFVFSLITSLKNGHQMVSRLYHLIHAIAFGLFLGALIVVENTFSNIVNCSSLFFLVYGLTELMFCFQLLNKKMNLKPKILFIRIILGFVISLGSVLFVSFFDSYQDFALIGYGVLFLITGISILLFTTIFYKCDTVAPKAMNEHITKVK
jgi:hypothetical protein